MSAATAERAAREIGGPPGLGHDEPGQARLLGPPAQFARPAQRLGGQHGVEAQRHLAYAARGAVGRPSRRTGTQSLMLGKYSSVWSTVPAAA